jgi:hypothetical protein
MRTPREVVQAWVDAFRADVLRGCGFFRVADGVIRLQRDYRDRLSFLRQHGLPIPED